MKTPNRFRFLALLLVILNTPAHAATDINWVQKELDTQQFTSIEGFLATLPLDYRTLFTLVYNSGSLQQATSAKPRVISFGTDGSLVFAFNSGDATLRGSDTVELIQFDLPTTRFRFYEISKSPATGKLQLQAQTDKCEGCHRASDLRPNWQPYANWPGAYGSNAESLSSDEQIGYVSFLKDSKTNPRYATLLGLPLVTPAQDAILNGDPNTGLSDKLSQWNYMRVARLVRASTDYDAYKYAILGASNCVSEFAQFFPNSNPLPSNWASYGGSDDDWVNAFAYIFESRGINWQDWPMTITGVTSEFADHNPFAAGFTFGPDIIANVVKQDVELRAYANVTETLYAQGTTLRSVAVNNCDALAKLSVAALSQH
jgi:hypothetical protein